MDWSNVVLAIDNAAHVNNRARLHAKGCQALRRYNGKRGLMQIDFDVQAHTEQLEEDGYPVAKCKCVK